MTFQALLVSKDDDAAAVLTPVLSGSGVGVQSCGYPDALVRLTEQKFDAVIVDYDDPHSAALVLQNATQPSSGNAAVTVALLSDKTRVRNVFGAGANFVLYKPISEAQAQSSLRSATALIKRERRRSFRVAVQVPVQLRVSNGAQTGERSGPEVEGILLDLSEDGMDLLSAQPLCPASTIHARFALPDGGPEIDLRGEVCWANPNGQSGIRFVEMSDSLRSHLQTWVADNAQELPPEEPDPVSECKLTDLSLGGCYVETVSPFPERSGITLGLKAGDIQVEAEGLVRVMHPECGMGIEFASATPEQRVQVASFIEFLTSQPGTTPELLITPRTLAVADSYDASQSQEQDDALLALLRHHESLSQEEFLAELRKQRNSEEVASQ